MSLVTTGTMPQVEQTWNVAVRVPKAYFVTASGSRTVTRSAPFGLDVHTPPCFTQKVQPQARAGISTGSGSHVSAKAMLPQWQRPRITTGLAAHHLEGRVDRLHLAALRLHQRDLPALAHQEAVRDGALAQDVAAGLRALREGFVVALVVAVELL